MLRPTVFSALSSLLCFLLPFALLESAMASRRGQKLKVFHDSEDEYLYGGFSDGESTPDPSSSDCESGSEGDATLEELEPTNWEGYKTDERAAKRSFDHPGLAGPNNSEEKEEEVEGDDGKAEGDDGKAEDDEDGKDGAGGDGAGGYSDEGAGDDGGIGSDEDAGAEDNDDSGDDGDNEEDNDEDGEDSSDSNDDEGGAGGDNGVGAGPQDLKRCRIMAPGPAQ